MTDYNSEITEIESKIPSISGLATNVALTTVGNKVPNISTLVKKTDYIANINEVEKKLTDHNHDKYVTNSEFKHLAEGVFTARLEHVNLVTKTNFDTKLIKISKKLNSNKTKHLLFEKIKNIFFRLFYR